MSIFENPIYFLEKIVETKKRGVFNILFLKQLKAALSYFKNNIFN
jgi:hypothetical protein